MSASTLFAIIAATMPKAEPKAPAVPLATIGECTTIEELGEALNEVKAQKQYVSFRTLAKAVGQKGAFRPSNIPVLLHAVSQAGPGLQALIVNERGQQAAKVAEGHRATLEGFGYEAYPEVKTAKAKKAVEAQEVI